MKTMFKRKNQQNDTTPAEAQKQAGNSQKNARPGALLNNIEKSVIDEVSEAEENNTTQVKIGKNFSDATKSSNKTEFLKNAAKNLMDPYADADRKAAERD